MWYTIDCLGSWADGGIFDRSKEFLNRLLENLWILGNSAFPIILSRVENEKK
jgi:hypothetical protein